ncbi:hypothetical protein C6V83_18160 [Gordonia iterans]|uniref:Uncharacterized protein n=1 Tax=Gordonia iterans TaxID=1004901 RepID=A0A2S0KJR2_9ACTN|nr:hypothetical protein [Gordonia iterans]AVM01903.1 hypothetical protein C6V83_18160 [Gordonia iterans]
MPKPAGNAQVIADRQRATRAVELRAQGHTYQEIADALDYADRTVAYRAVLRTINRNEAQVVDDFRDLMAERYEALYERALKELDAAASKGREMGKSQLINSARQALDSLARIRGIDKTPTVNVTTTTTVSASQEAIATEIAGLADALRTKLRADADAAGLAPPELPVLDGIVAAVTYDDETPDDQ